MRSVLDLVRLFVIILNISQIKILSSKIVYILLAILLLRRIKGSVDTFLRHHFVALCVKCTWRTAFPIPALDPYCKQIARLKSSHLHECLFFFFFLLVHLFVFSCFGGFWKFINLRMIKWWSFPFWLHTLYRVCAGYRKGGCLDVNTV